ncbi:MAG: ATP-binding protein [Gemmatimonadota bacterium]
MVDIRAHLGTFRQIATGRAPGPDDPPGWREKLLDVTLVAAFLLGVLTALPGVVAAVPREDWALLAVDGGSIICLAVITFRRSLAYRFRAWSFLLLVFALGTWFLGTVGALSLVYLMAVPILTVLLLGFVPALAQLAINGITVVLVGYLFAPDVPIPRYSDAPLLHWVLVSLNLTFVSAVITAGVAYLLRHLEAALLEQRRVSAAIEQAGEAVVLGGLDGRISYANAAARLMLEAVALPRGNASRRIQHLVRPLQGPLGMPVSLEESLPWEGEIELSGDDGPRQIRISISPLRDDGDEVTGFVGFLQDVTRERRMEARVRRGERLEALGTLSGGVAHDFNNIIGSILGLVDDVRSRAPSPAIAMSLDAIVRACLRAREVVRQMMVFGRKAPLERRSIPIRETVEEALTLVRAGTPAGIEVRSSLRSEARVLAGSAEIHQVLMNLCTNAVQAMESASEGKLSVGLHDADPPPDIPDEDGEDTGDGPGHVCLTVTDTGTGIPAEHLSQIFDPFFTTKTSTHGTGLGLASVYGIVRSMGGDIRVYSEPGSGTTFRVYFPMDRSTGSEPSTEPEADADADSGASDGNRGEERVIHVLVVDDEEVLRRMTARTLRRLGHETTESRHGAEALEAVTADPEAFDVVLTDLTMPVMGGAELIRRLKEVRPGLPVVLASGFADTPEGRALDSSDRVVFLPKPFTRRELAHALDEALRAREPASEGDGP